YYLVQEYGFRVERERKESERKLIEAQGIRSFQQTVTQGITDSYLRWRGIEATLQLSQSNNTKIVIIGSAKDGLPIILGNVDTPQSAAPQPSSDNSAGPRDNNVSPQPLERTPADNLSAPADKRTNDIQPPAQGGSATDLEKRSNVTPIAPRSVLSRIGDFVSGIVHSSEPLKPPPLAARP